MGTCDAHSRPDVAGLGAIRAPRGVRRLARGVTLLETVLVTAIVGLLVLLLMPPVAWMQKGARAAVTLSNLRSHAAVFALYVSDHREAYPRYTDPEATTVLRAPGIVMEVYDYFAGYSVWHIALANEYFDSGWNTGAFYAPGSGYRTVSTYWYAASFLARPAFWNTETRTGPAQWQETRSADVLFPSSKGVLYSIFPRTEELQAGRPGPGAAVGFVDGSSRFVIESEFTRPYPTGEGRWRGSWFNTGMPVMHTIDGAGGRDVGTTPEFRFRPSGRDNGGAFDF